jgi:hypothetical protein
MTHKAATRLELIGALLVLMSAGWELFIERPVLDIQQDQVSFRIENKLDFLWLQVGAIRHKVEPDGNFAWTISPSDASKEWPASGDRRDLERVSRQATYAKAFRGLLFLIGSLMLIGARRDELQRSSHSPVEGPGRQQAKLTS